MLTNILSVERRRRNDDDDDGLGDYHYDVGDGNEDLDDDVDDDDDYDDADDVAVDEYDECRQHNDDTYAAADDDGRSVGEAGRHVACAVSTSFQERERHLTPGALEASQGVWEPTFQRQSRSILEILEISGNHCLYFGNFGMLNLFISFS